MEALIGGSGDRRNVPLGKHELLGAEARYRVDQQRYIVRFT